MSALSIIYALLFYFAALVLVAGVTNKVIQYAKTPAPLKIPTTPAPVTQTGVVMRMAREVVLFSSLFKANKWIWLFGWMFHFALLIVLLPHLRYFIDPAWSWIAWVVPLGKYAAFAMVLGLLGLWMRRFFVQRIRYISSPSDHLMLVLLISIALTGMAMRFIWHTDISSVQDFFVGLLHLNWKPLPADPILLIHLGLVASLMIIFPFSKLLHAPGVFFSPTRNQVDNPREKRHLAPWAAELEK